MHYQLIKELSYEELDLKERAAEVAECGTRERVINDAITLLLCKLLSYISQTSHSDLFILPNFVKVSTLVEEMEMGRKLELRKALANGWCCLLDVPEIQTNVNIENEIEMLEPQDHDRTEQSRRATERAWGISFKGKTVTAFVDTMNECLKNPKPYAHCISVVQSSGTGKSRLIDELSKSIITLRMNLRNSLHDGFPPSDTEVARYFMESKFAHLDKKKIQQRIHSFFIALFNCALQELVDVLREERAAFQPPIEVIAGAFRRRMCIGQTYYKQNENRIKFYDKVVKRAENLQLAPAPEALTSNQGSAALQLSPEFNFDGDDGKPQNLPMSAQRLIDFIDKQATHDGSTNAIKLVLEFDEAPGLTEAAKGNTVKWSMMSELRRALRTIRGHPIFSVFLSTVGKVGLIATPRQLDPSERVQSLDLVAHTPYTALGFDLLFKKPKKKKNYTIDYVIKPKFYVKFSRPLFSSRYTMGSQEIKDAIVEFAQQKLTATSGAPDFHGQFACLAVRLPLEFNATTSEGIDRERTQIESHMRICLGISPGNEYLVSVAPSEPVLVEASIRAMTKFNVPLSLLSHLEKPGLAKGDRGELVGMLLLLRARDRIHEGAFCFSVPTFLKNLLHADHHDTLARCIPTDAHLTGHRTPLLEKFRNSHSHFTHFIKVEDYKVINRDFLWLMLQRGTGILCANNQRGIDAIIVGCLKGKKISKENIFVTLYQFKNDEEIKRYFQTLFDLMDPVRLGIFSKKDYDIPVIRMVISLDVKVPVVQLAPVPVKVNPPRELKESLGKRCTWAYDIFVGGADSSIFAPIDKDDTTTYQNLLKSNRLSDKYILNGKSKLVESITRSMYPWVGSHRGHWMHGGNSDDEADEEGDEADEEGDEADEESDEADEESDDSSQLS